MSSSPSSEMIRSKAVVLYSGDSATPDRVPVRVTELAQNTNINFPPLSAWIHDYRFSPTPDGMRKKSVCNIYESFMTSNRYIDFVGAVDAISEAENIKELLKLPFAHEKALSLVVHRIGRTLLFDNFDFVQQRQDDLQWMRPFAEQSIRCLNEATRGTHDPTMAVATRGPSISELNEHFMLSNFLSHSTECFLDEIASCDRVDADCGDNRNDAAVVLSSAYPVPDPLDQDSERAAQNSSVDQGYTNLWTLDDMQMLVGVDMPIFGCGKHPCVSLKLKDMKRPINVLTGVDYWLDQLMCNVPEVLMCYHLNGIIQNYEIIKTEELPHLKDSRFDPELVKDVAQNILGFLRDKITKEGHTYWLYKEEGSEVVKLYDLSSLCSANESLMDHRAANPWTLPVAVLMYRVARNLQRRSAQRRTRRVANTVYRLLNNCLDLLSREHFPQVVGSVHYLLANLYLSYGADGLPGAPRSDNDDDEGEDTSSSWAVDESWQQQKSPGGKPASSATITMDALSRKNNKKSKRPTSDNAMPANAPPPSRQLPLPNCTNMDDCCKQALEHVYEMYERSARPNKDEEAAEADAMANSPLPDPAQAIPMHYLPLNEQQPATLLPLAVRRPISGWQMDLMSLLLIRAATAYRMCADCSSSLGHLGRSICQARLGLQCTGIFSYCRDGVVNRELKDEMARWSPYRDRMIQAKADALLSQAASAGPHRDCETMLDSLRRLPASSHALLTLAERCYSHAMTQARACATSSRTCAFTRCIFEPTQNAIVDCKTIARRLGNLKNVAGIAHIDVLKRCVCDGKLSEFSALQLGLDSDPTDGDDDGELRVIDRIVAVGVRIFLQGVEYFASAGDAANQALLYSNCGQLHRLHFHAVAATTSKRREISRHEREMMLKAIEFYQRGLDCVQSTEESGDNHTWEMVATELASTFYTYAVQLQERPPLSTASNEQVEQEVIELMQRALGAYEMLRSRVVDDNRLQAMTQARCFDIHYRIASLCHNAMRQKEEMSRRRKARLRGVCEQHYADAAVGYGRMVERWPLTRSPAAAAQFLRLQMERAAFAEFVNAASTGPMNPQQQMRLLRKNLEMLSLACANDLQYLMMATTNGELAEKKGNNNADLIQEIYKLCGMLLERIQHVCKAIVQFGRQHQSAGLSANELDQWKRIYGITLVGGNGVGESSSDVLARVYGICDQLSSNSNWQCLIRAT